MRRRLLMISTAALLAGTAMAVGQGTMEHKDSGSQPGASQGQSGQAQPKGAEQSKGRETQGQGQMQPGQAQGQKSQPSTTGQAPRGEERNRAEKNLRNQGEKGAQGPMQHERDQKGAQGKSEKDRIRTQGQNQRDQDQQRTQGQMQRDQKMHEGQRESSSKGSVTLTTEQRTKIRETVLQGRSAPRASRVDFSINVGTVVPRTVHIVEVPRTIVEIHPEWRGYRYFVYNDEIIIVEPRTLRIVAVVVV